MFDRTIGLDPRPAAPHSRAIYRMRDGHRREYAASRDRGSISFRERCRGALADVGIYGAVSVRDLAQAHFGGHPYTTRRAVNAWIREGLVKETTATGPKGTPFKILTLTRSGVVAARKLASGRGLDPGQEIRTARLRRSEVAHDTAVYRACRKEYRRLLEQGTVIRRVRLDGEFKSAVARKSESARAKDGRRAADAERHRVAEELGLPIDAQGRVLYPDAQIEYTDPEGRTGRVNIEVASGNYRARSTMPKRPPGSGCTPTDRPRRACSAHSAWATAKIAPPCEGRPTGIRPRSNSDPPEGPAMQPWRISAGLTATLVGSGLLLAGPHLEYLAPFWPLIITDHGISISLHAALALAAVVAAIYAIARPRTQEGRRGRVGVNTEIGSAANRSSGPGSADVTDRTSLESLPDTWRTQAKTLRQYGGKTPARSPRGLRGGATRGHARVP